MKSINTKQPINNNTDKYAVVIDNYFGFAVSQEEAEKIVNIDIGDIGESAHGYCCIYPPLAKDKYKEGDYQNLSEYQAINIQDFAKKRTKRAGQKYDRRFIDRLDGKSWLPIRFINFKTLKSSPIPKSYNDIDWDSLLDNVAPTTDEELKQERIKSWLKAVPNADINKYNFDEYWWME